MAGYDMDRFDEGSWNPSTLSRVGPGPHHRRIHPEFLRQLSDSIQYNDYFEVSRFVLIGSGVSLQTP